MRNDTARSMFSSYQAKLGSVGVRTGWLENEGRGGFERESISDGPMRTGGARSQHRVVGVASPQQERCRAASHSGFDQVVAKANAELGHLSVILGQLGCAAQLRQMEGTVRPLNARDSADDSVVPTLCVPIYDPEGRAYASLDLTHCAVEGSAAPDRSSARIRRLV